MQKRPGSILATSISMIAIFLTMIVASMAYVETSAKGAMSDRWRSVAEQAARSGMDFVLGWAEQNIDRQTNLPVDWASMADGDVIDPVKLHAKGITPKATLSELFADPSPTAQVLGTNTGEYVLGIMGDKVVTFKARIQQYRVSDDMPRQFRVGVIGRVRTRNNGGLQTIDTHEGTRFSPGSKLNGSPNSGTLLAERMIMSEIGRVPTSRFAALIDIDLVKNWVPGERVYGPVHINRGYPDQDPYTNDAVTIAANTNLQNGQSSLAQRSQMKLHVNPNSVFDTPAGADPYPVFYDEVSMTAVTANDPVSRYTNKDPVNYSTAIRMMNGSTDENYLAANAKVANNASNIFRALENQNRAEWGFVAGPIVYPQPVTLPTSVRNALPNVFGSTPGVLRNSNYFANTMPDGVYLGSPNVLNGQAPVGPLNDSGIYVRGNVEIMRMMVDQDQPEYSYYLFQLGYGQGSAFTRSYGVLVNRTTKDVWVRAWPTGQDLQFIIGNQGRNTRELLFPGAGPNSGLSGGGVSPTASTSANDFGINRAGAPWNHIPGAANPGKFALNGLIYIDYSLADPNRNANPLIDDDAPSATRTGNIFSLGNFSPNKGLLRLEGISEERVASYSNGPGGPSSRVTIMARGNIFIQNSIKMEAFSRIAPAFNPAALDAANPASNVDVKECTDLLGMVADKQVVIGLHAPSTTTRSNVGVEIHATVAALGDPGAGDDGTVPNNEMMGNRAFRGSFTTEGLMQVFPDTTLTENYGVCVGLPNQTWAPGQQGYPGNSLYARYGSPYQLLSTNPNTQSTRGRLMLFGSVTQKKRGIVGIANRSYDKDIRFDRRLLTLMPPIFPISVNMVTHTVNPFTPEPKDLPYNGTGGAPKYRFMGQ